MTLILTEQQIKMLIALFSPEAVQHSPEMADLKADLEIQLNKQRGGRRRTLLPKLIPRQITREVFDRLESEFEALVKQHGYLKKEIRDECDHDLEQGTYPVWVNALKEEATILIPGSPLASVMYWVDGVPFTLDEAKDYLTKKQEKQS